MEQAVPSSVGPYEDGGIRGRLRHSLRGGILDATFVLVALPPL